MWIQGLMARSFTVSDNGTVHTPMMTGQLVSAGSSSQQLRAAWSSMLSRLAATTFALFLSLSLAKCYMLLPKTEADHLARCYYLECCVGRVGVDDFECPFPTFFFAANSSIYLPIHEVVFVALNEPKLTYTTISNLARSEFNFSGLFWNQDIPTKTGRKAPEPFVGSLPNGLFFGLSIKVNCIFSLVPSFVCRTWQDI